MARERTIKVAGLNVRVGRPHNAERYRSLIKAAFRLKQPISVRGNDRVIISQLDRSTAESSSVSGFLAKYTHIDKDLPWFDAGNLDVVEGEVASQIKNLPPNTGPNYKAIAFYFDFNKHEIIFETYSAGDMLSPNLGLIFFRELFSLPDIRREFGEVNVDLMADEGQLESLLDNETLRKLTIVIRRPNADDIGRDYEHLFEMGLVDQNASQITLNLQRQPGEYLEPNALTRAAARVGSNNGTVTAEIEENGVPVLKSTSSFPRFGSAKYDPKIKTDRQGFMAAVLAFFAA